ncbi:PDR/VanB family oxidoreductase [Nocardia arthritidis]|uniref:2Fe-2S iron-sulfur cluster binding domain-containing protein n=1 Tax=Nocardia arthritidis TaxID=228602 RepID=A0A6G9YQY5_9NOCA|nr:PDR/VanB family oxidoreductase [Nocardia arthritidis]QIS15530.1 2Fe-2S iron-sulfur cluster binding domain-containing protein [Nocardia arthritidis]
MKELVHGDTPIPDPGHLHPGMRLMLGLAGGYKRLVAVNPLTSRISLANPVRRTGFDLNLVIESVTAAAEDVVGLTLVAPDGRALPRWIPGAHLDVFLPSGRQRQYSLCGDPEDRFRYRIAVRRIVDGGGGSLEVHETLRAGEPVHIRGPRNAFRMVAARRYYFVAGGIGITPILPMVHTAHRHGIPWRLVYLGRSRESMPFREELAGYTSGRVDIRTDDEFGVPDVPALFADMPRNEAAYVCGPPPILDGARRTLTARGAGYELHTERFSPPPVLGGSPFQVELRRSAITVEVGAQQSVLAAVKQAVPGVPYSCQQGFCGSCRTTVLDGTVERHGGDKAFAGADSMLICVSRCTDRLVLDL